MSKKEPFAVPAEKKGNNVLSIFLYLLLGVIFVFSLALVYPVYKNYAKQRDNVAALNEELDEKVAECMALAREVHDLERLPSAAEKVARDKYNLCREGELVIKYDK